MKGTIGASGPMTDDRCDVLVIGGGPAGSTISALLAQRGRDVVLLEKARHPRFHIGESLLPFNLPLFERLGLGDEIRSIGMPKYGAEFVSQWHEQPVHVDFANAWDRSFPSTYQVRRSEFDRILFRNAARKGAKTVEGCRVTGVDFHPDGAEVTARQDDGQQQRWQARFVADASGRDTFLANRLGIKQRNRKHNTAALFGHFAGARRLPGRIEGNISLFWFEHGWFWFIPLADGATSIGAVCSPQYMKSRKTDPRRFLLDTIALCPSLAERLRDASLVSPVTATGNYSYRAEHPSGRNHLLLGDAFAFVDPVFSTGVLLAMQSAFVGADTIETCLDRPREARGALKAFDASTRHGLRVFSWFIYRVMTPGLRHLLMNPTQRFRLQPAVLSVLAGDIFRGTPVGLRLLVFKILYYFNSVLSLRTSLMAWRQRKQAIQDAGAETATQEPAT
ncbi:MAG: NAD(P)/FAD-dependent oxidoreductase [Burkholderiales bacterium]